MNDVDGDFRDGADVGQDVMECSFSTKGKRIKERGFPKGNGPCFGCDMVVLVSVHY